MLLAACGGGGPDGTGTSATSSSGGGNAKLLPYSPYTAGSLRSAPADGATLSGIVRLEIGGYLLYNVKLLPADGSEPAYGVFNQVDGYEFDPESGVLDLDTTKLPNGPLQVKILASGSGRTYNGEDYVFMSPRTWNINNTGTTATALSASVAAAPESGATLSGTTRLEVRGTGLTNVELLPETGYAPKLGVFNVSADRTYAWLDLDTRALPDGVQTARISAFDMTAGQPGATEVIAMPARQWTVSNGTDPGFTAKLLMAPLHGETISGPIKLDVSGTDIQNIELLPADGYDPKYGKGILYTTGKDGYIEFDPKTLPPGLHEFRLSVFNRAPGAADAQEIVIMPARQWNIQY